MAELRDDHWWDFDPDDDDPLSVYLRDRYIPKPDRIIALGLMDPSERLEKGWPYPFPGQRTPRWAGCYLIYADRLDGRGMDFIYAGQTVSLGIRLSQHCCQTGGSTVFDEYSILDREALPWFAVWYIPEKKERARFEHKLIGNLPLILNQA